MLLVKLNNPLMGTETAYVVPIESWDEFEEVKLNNPLMGTETIKPIQMFFVLFNRIVLN